MKEPPRTIVIVGAGFSGTVVAINLLQRQSAEGLRLLLVARDARQVATWPTPDREYPYLLNINADQMSADAGDPQDFLKFAQKSKPGVSGEDFLPRSLYGQYLQAFLHQAEINAASGTWLERVSGTATSVRCLSNGHRYGVELADGRTLIADDVVLALGNPPSDGLPGSQALLGSAAYVADPWSTPVQFRSGERVLVVGTGLTMADVVIAGTHAARGETQVFLAWSLTRLSGLLRRGTLPPPWHELSSSNRIPTRPRENLSRAARRHTSRFKRITFQRHAAGGRTARRTGRQVRSKPRC